MAAGGQLKRKQYFMSIMETQKIMPKFNPPNRIIAHKVGCALNAICRQGKNQFGSPLEKFCLFADMPGEWQDLRQMAPLNEIMFYAWQEAWQRNLTWPYGSTVSYDLLVLMANVAFMGLERERLGEILIDSDLALGAALLLAGGKGLNFIVGGIPRARLLATLNKSFPDNEWSGQGSKVEITRPFLYLGATSEDLRPQTTNFFDLAPHLGAGAVLAPVAALGVQRCAEMRGEWVNSGLMRSVLQTPMRALPGRRDSHGALFELGPKGMEPVRMAVLPHVSEQRTALDLGAAIKVLEARHCRPGEAVDVPVAELVNKGAYTLSPGFYQVAGLKTKAREGVLLRDAALILRCQLSRDKIGEADAQRIAPGSSLARELTLAECDSITGFFDEYAASFVQVPFDRFSSNKKFFLKPNDILFSFRGTQKSVGQTGFVHQLGGPAVAALSLCVIRALPGFDPVWLYHYLRRPEVLAVIRAQAVGGGLVNVNASQLQELPLVLPSPAELEAIRASHAQLGENFSEIIRLRNKNRNILKEIDANFSGLEE